MYSLLCLSTASESEHSQMLVLCVYVVSVCVAGPIARHDNELSPSLGDLRMFSLMLASRRCSQGLPLDKSFRLVCRDDIVQKMLQKAGAADCPLL